MSQSQSASLLFLLTDEQILLAMKKRGFGEGRWNGVGGKPEPGETIEQTAVRECQEEIEVIPKALIRVAELHFYMHKTSKIAELHCTVFVSYKWQGTPAETDEMAPQWFQRDVIPYDRMWSDDKYWLPEVLKGNFVEANFSFDANERVIDHELSLKANPDFLPAKSSAAN